METLMWVVGIFFGTPVVAGVIYMVVCGVIVPLTLLASLAWLNAAAWSAEKCGLRPTLYDKWAKFLEHKLNKWPK